MSIKKIFFFIENDIRPKASKKNPAELIAGQVTVQSEKESVLSKKLRKLEKKDKSKYSTVEVRQLSISVTYLISFHYFNILGLRLNMTLLKVHQYLKKVLPNV